MDARTQEQDGTTDLRDAIMCWELVRDELKDWEETILSAKPKDDSEAALQHNFKRFVR